MLHRRPGAPSLGDPSTGQINPATPSSTNTNSAYEPLWRGSSDLYYTPASGPKARYNLPPASPHGHVPGGGSYIGRGGIPTPYGGVVSGGNGHANVGNGHGGNVGNGNGYGGNVGLTGNTGYGGTYDLTEGLEMSGGGMRGWTKMGKDEWKQVARGGFERFKRGLEDAGRLDRSWSLVWADVELRTLVVKSTLINLVSLLLLALSPLRLSPSLSLSRDAQLRTQAVGLWYNILLSWPVFVVCFWINASWAPDISRRAHTLLHPSYRHQPPGSPINMTTFKRNRPNPLTWIFTSVQRLLLISDFTLVSRVIMLVPLIGRTGALTYMCGINAYYCFGSTFVSEGWGLDRRVAYMQERAAYMIGFGVPATLLSSFGPPLVNMAVFALIYPFFVIQAILARPPTPRSSLLPSTPSPRSSLPSSPDGTSGLNLSDPFFTHFDQDRQRMSGLSGWRFELKMPIFFFARYAIMALDWLEVALGRDRSSGPRGLGYKERSGKRLG